MNWLFKVVGRLVAFVLLYFIFVMLARSPVLTIVMGGAPAEIAAAIVHLLWFTAALVGGIVAVLIHE